MKHYYVRHGRRVNGNPRRRTACLPPYAAAVGAKRRETSGERRCKDVTGARARREKRTPISESDLNKAAEKEGETQALPATFQPEGNGPLDQRATRALKAGAKFCFSIFYFLQIVKLSSGSASGTFLPEAEHIYPDDILLFWANRA